MWGGIGLQLAQTRQSLHIQQGKGRLPVYTQEGSKVALHICREGRFSLYTHRKGGVLVSTQGRRKGKGKILICTHREWLWILTGIPGSPEGPASPSSPVLPYTSEETVSTMSPPSPTQHTACCASSLWGKAVTYQFSLLAFGPCSSREPLSEQGSEVRVKIRAWSGSELK